MTECGLFVTTVSTVFAAVYVTVSSLVCTDVSRSVFYQRSQTFFIIFIKRIHKYLFNFFIYMLITTTAQIKQDQSQCQDFRGKVDLQR